jgi:tetratricopeptide (TPR) repeat protein
MKRTLEVCAVGVLLASGTLLAQDDEWKRLMARGQELERDANYSQAASAYLDAVRIARGRRLMIALNSLGLAYEEMGRFPDGERYFRRALEILEQLGGNNQADRALLLTKPRSSLRGSGADSQIGSSTSADDCPPNRLASVGGCAFDAGSRRLGGVGFERWELSGSRAYAAGIAGVF